MNLTNMMLSKRSQRQNNARHDSMEVKRQSGNSLSTEGSPGGTGSDREGAQGGVPFSGAG